MLTILRVCCSPLFLKMAKFDIAGCILQPPFLEMAKYSPDMAKTWSSHDPSNWFFLNFNQCAHGCSMPNFKLLGVLFIPLSKKCPKYGPLRPKHSPHVVLKIGSFWILINVPMDVPCQISHYWVHPVAPFLRNGQNMALFWPKHSSHIVFQIGSSLILLNLHRNVPC